MEEGPLLQRDLFLPSPSKCCNLHIRRSRSGRIVVPVLQFWRNQGKKLDQNGNFVFISEPTPNEELLQRTKKRKLESCNDCRDDSLKAMTGDDNEFFTVAERILASRVCTQRSFDKSGERLEIINKSIGDESSTGIINQLPREMLLHIFHFVCSRRDLCQMALVCKEWKSLSSDNDLWKRLYFERWSDFLPIQDKIGAKRTDEDCFPREISAEHDQMLLDSKEASVLIQQVPNWKQCFLYRRCQEREGKCLLEERICDDRRISLGLERNSMKRRKLRKERKDSLWSLKMRKFIQEKRDYFAMLDSEPLKVSYQGE